MKDPDRGRPRGSKEIDPLEEGYGLVLSDDLFDVEPEDRLERWNRSAYFTWMGLELTEADEGKARAVLPIHDRHRGGGGTPAVNGGVIAYAFDGVLGAAVASLQRGRPQVTLQLNITYLRLLAGARADWEAEVTQAGRTVVVCEARALDEQGRVCATAHCLYRVFEGSSRRTEGGDSEGAEREPA